MRASLCAAMIVAALFAAFFAGGKFLVSQPPPSATKTREVAAPRLETAAPAESSAAADQAVELSTDELQLAPKMDFVRGKLAWEKRIEDVLGSSDLSEAAQARQLLAMLPSLPEPALETATEEAVRRLPNADYEAIGLPVLANPQTHGLAAGVLFADLMQRPRAITLRALLRIARTPGHAYAPFALENLNLLLDEDHGTDWAQWNAAIAKALTGPAR